MEGIQVSQSFCFLLDVEVRTKPLMGMGILSFGLNN